MYAIRSYYVNSINPFLTTTDPLVDSVAEHATTSINQSFYFQSIFMVFSGLGIWFILTKNLREKYLENDMTIFVLFLGLIGVYVSSAFVRFV